jgi:zeaxanthin epoxidase
MNLVCHSPAPLLCRYVKFDTFHPAVSKGLPVTRVISRVTLQQILARAVER